MASRPPPTSQNVNQIETLDECQTDIKGDRDMKDLVYQLNTLENLWSIAMLQKDEDRAETLANEMRELRARMIEIASAN